MGALQYVDYPNYNAIIFRSTFSNLALPGAIMDRAINWLIPFEKSGDVRFNKSEKKFYFSTGATLSFGYLQNENDHYNYASSEYQYIGFDEVTEIRERSYKFLFSRLRKNIDNPIPLRVRAASNPLPNWVKDYFVDSNTIPFVKALLIDNPYINYDEYVKSLEHLHPVDRERILNGDWEIADMGNIFDRDDILNSITTIQPILPRKYRIWDLATTIKTSSDYTAGGLFGKDSTNTFYCLDMVRGKWEYPKSKEIIIKTAIQDGHSVQIGIESVGLAKGMVQDLKKELNQLGYVVIPIETSKDKFANSLPIQALFKANKFKLLQNYWNRDLIDEMIAFRGDNKTHDDQIDTLSMSFKLLSKNALSEAPMSYGKRNF